MTVGILQHSIEILAAGFLLIYLFRVGVRHPEILLTRSWPFLIGGGALLMLGVVFNLINTFSGHDDATWNTLLVVALLTELLGLVAVMIGFHQWVSGAIRLSVSEQELSQSYQPLQGEDFYHTCVRTLARVYGAHYAFISIFDDDSYSSATTIAALADGKIIDNLSYELDGTPCQDVVECTISLISRNVAQRYPKDILLREMEAESYFGVPLIGCDGKPLGLVTVLDIKPMYPSPSTNAVLSIFGDRIAYELERSTVEDNLKSANRRFQAFISAMPDLAFVLDAQGNYIEVLGAADVLSRSSARRFKGTSIHDHLLPELAAQVLETIRKTLQTDEVQSLEYSLDVADRRRVFEGRCTVMNCNQLDGQHVVWISRDITKRRDAEERIRHQVYHDSLSGLPNRRMLLEHLYAEVARARRHGHLGALLFLDLDHFKTVNDSLGHPIGDALLRSVADSLRKAVRQEDMVARLGGDEFVILLPELGDDLKSATRRAREAADKLLEAVSIPREINGHELHVNGSMGLVVFPQGDESVDDLVKQADTALYRAKDTGRNTMRFFEPEMQKAAEEHLQLRNDLRQAMRQQSLFVQIQPQMNAKGELIGGEALLRWHHPERGLVSPAEFIPIAEESGLIIELGSWVLREACRHLAQWEEKGLTRQLRHLSVNVSSLQFHHHGFVELVKQVLVETSIDPCHLMLEMTESALLQNKQQAVERMQSLRLLGLSFSIDDFGTGYSSLAYLRDLPLEQLKIDRSFIQDIHTEPRNAAIVETIIAMASNLHLDLIAEGVETENELAFLSEHGCQTYQGFYFSRPMSVADFAGLLSRQTAEIQALPLPKQLGS